MFTVYLDESYGTADAYAVAGYVATAAQWIEFEREWLALCDRVGVRYIHKEELEHLWGEFRYAQEWPKERQDQLKIDVDKLAAGIILRRVNAGFAAAVCKSDWLATDKGKWASVLGESFYAGGVFACFRLIATWMHNFKRNEPMRYVLEAGADGRHEVEGVLRMTEDTPEATAMARMAGWSFEYKKERVIKKTTYPGTIQLQAADFLAYEIYREKDNRGFEGVKKNKYGREIPTRRVLHTLFQRDQPEYDTLHASELPTPYYLIWIDKAKVEEIVTDFDRMFPNVT